MTGIVLAGGRGLRIKREKPLIRLGSRSILRRICETLDPLVEDKIVSIGDQTDAESILASLDGFPGWRTCRDRIPARGPLGGIHSGLLEASAPHALVVACDMPFLNAAFIHHMMGLIGEFDAVVPRLRRGFEPLLAVYSKSCLPIITSLLTEGRSSILDLIPQVNVRTVEEREVRAFDAQLLSFFNINTERDLSRALEVMEGPTTLPS